MNNPGGHVRSDLTYQIWTQEKEVTERNRSLPVKTSLIDEDGKFIPATGFNGHKKSFVFKNGSKGLGYYEDRGFKAIDSAKTEVDKIDQAELPVSSVSASDPAWVAMRTVAQVSSFRYS